MLFYILYNLFFPLAFLFFLPGLLVKLIRRPGIKRNASPFSPKRKRRA